MKSLAPHTFKFLSSAVMVPLCLHPVYAQDKPIQKDEQQIETLVVTSNPMNRTVLESATPVSILAGDDLESRIAPTLGETLKNVPGVNSTYFGPVSSSPVIRGLDGPRVKVLQNGLDVSDASRIGPDHIVSTETANARQIEVLRGPATLLFGSGAIGGVVNVVDNRLPTEAIDGTQGKASYLHDSVSGEDLFNVDFDAGHKNWLWHFDAFDRATEDYSVPEFVNDEGEQNSTLENSFIDADGFSTGLGWQTKRFNAAVSYGQLNSDYGIPGHAHGEHDEEHEEEHEEDHMDGEDEHEHGEESVFGRVKQDRWQGLVDWHPAQGPFSEVQFRTAYTDYTHSEIEEGEVGTTFDNDTFESRLWGKHTPINDWIGVIGLSHTQSEFSALGEEAFTPASDTAATALFLLEEKQFGEVLWQLGGRIERTRIEVDNQFFDNSEQVSSLIQFDDQTYTAASASVGAVWSISQQHTLSANYAHSQRAPSASELFSNGLHIATNTFEVGAALQVSQLDEDELNIEASDVEVNKEKSNNVDLTYHYTSEHIEATVSVFYNQINDYIFQQNTGLTFSSEHHEGEEEEEEHEEHEDGVAVFAFAQQDADIYGFEAELDWHFNEQWRLESFADYSKAELSDGQAVPRIPPMRLGVEFHWENLDWHVELGATYYAKQDEIAEFETVTQGYTLINASLSYYSNIGNNDLVLFLRGNNLTDKLAFVHTSFIKEDAPLPGRSVVLGARVNF